MERWNVYLEEVAQSIKSVICLILVFISLKKKSDFRPSNQLVEILIFIFRRKICYTSSLSSGNLYISVSGKRC